LQAISDTHYGRYEKVSFGVSTSAKVPLPATTCWALSLLPCACWPSRCGRFSLS